MEFKIKGLTVENYGQIEELKQKTMLEYFNRGYKQPNYALTVIGDVYNDIYARETIKAEAEAYKKGKPFDGLSVNKTETKIITVIHVKRCNNSNGKSPCTYSLMNK